MPKIDDCKVVSDPNSRLGTTLEERYAYYRRCQVVRRNGEQCKAPAEKGEHICYKHAEQMEMARRRREERRAVLEHAVAMSRRAGQEIEDAAELFLSFNGIQRVISASAQALIDGRIECKTAGRLAVELQTAAKLLRLQDAYRKGRNGRKGSQELPQMNADERRMKQELVNRTAARFHGQEVACNAEARSRGEKQELPQMNADERRSGIGSSGHREIGPSEEKEAPWNNTEFTVAKEAQAYRCSAVPGRGRRRMERRSSPAKSPSFLRSSCSISV